MKPYYEHDGITIYHGDCREILPTLPNVDAVITDPPYGLSGGGVQVGQRGKGSRSLDFFENDDMCCGLAHVETIRRAAEHCGALSVYAWLGHQQFSLATSVFEDDGWSTRFLVWARKCPVPPPPGAGWPSGASLCLYAYKPGRVWHPESAKSPRSNVLHADSYRHGQPGKNGHPTQMRPVLVAEPIRCSTAPGQIVLDPFVGSGTTLRAAKDLGRKAIGIEIEEKYCEIAAERMAQEVLPLGVK